MNRNRLNDLIARYPMTGIYVLLCLTAVALVFIVLEPR